MNGRRCSSSAVGQVALPMTLSSSSCARIWISGLEGTRARNHWIVPEIYQNVDEHSPKKCYIGLTLTECTPPRVKTAASIHMSSQSRPSPSRVWIRVLARQSGTSSPASSLALTRRIIAPYTSMISSCNFLPLDLVRVGIH